MAKIATVFLFVIFSFSGWAQLLDPASKKTGNKIVNGLFGPPVTDDTLINGVFNLPGESMEVTRQASPTQSFEIIEYDLPSNVEPWQFGWGPTLEYAVVNGEWDQTVEGGCWFNYDLNKPMCRIYLYYTAAEAGEYRFDAVFSNRVKWEWVWDQRYIKPYSVIVKVTQAPPPPKPTPTPAPSPSPTPPDEAPVCQNGVNMSSKDSNFVIPAVGTGAVMVFSPTFNQSFLGRKIGIKNFNPDSFSVVGVNVYIADPPKVPGDPEYGVLSGTLYSGDGKIKRTRHFMDSNGNLNVFYNNEISVFDDSGQQIYTKNTLTGAIEKTFNYTIDGYLLSIDEPFNRKTVFQRDSDNVLQAIYSLPFNNTTRFYRNTANQVSRILGPDFQSTKFQYVTVGNKTLMKEIEKPGGQKKTFYYDANGALTGDSTSGGQSSSYGYSSINNGNGSLATTTSAVGRISSLSMEPNSTNGTYKTIAIEPSGFSSTVYTSSNGSQSISTPFRSMTITKQSDARFGDLRFVPGTIVENVGTKTRTTVFSETVSGATSPINYLTLISSASVNGISTVTVFDKNTGTIITTLPTGTELKTLINAHEMPVLTRVGLDNQTYIEYNPKGLVSRIEQGSNQRNYEYDARGFLSKFTNALGMTWLYKNDNAGRVLEATSPDASTVKYAYDPNGKIKSIQRGIRPEHKFNYNLSELIQTYQPPPLAAHATVDTSYEYNLDGQLTKIARPDSKEINFSYGSGSGRLNSIAMDSETQSYTYKPNSMLESVTSFDGVTSDVTFFGDVGLKSEEVSYPGGSSSTISFEFDNFFRVTSRTITSDFINSTIQLGYNDIGQVTLAGDLNIGYDSVSGRKSNSSIGNITDSYSYDGNGKLLSYSAFHNPPGGSPALLYSYTLVRDKSDRIVEKYETIAGVTTHYCYVYDKVGRLNSVFKDGIIQNMYGYDSNGNRVSGIIDKEKFAAAVDDQDRLLSYNSTAFGYNSNGELETIEKNVSTSTHLSYDSLGKLKSVVLPNGALLNYGLDWRSRRIYKKLNGVVTQRAIYEGDLRLVGISDDNLGQIEFVYSNGVNSPDYMIKNGLKYYFVKDHLGSVRFVVDINSGTTVQMISYNEWGKELSNSNPNMQPFSFAGGILERGAGLVHFGARDYDPEVGRWISKDPILFGGGDTNLYRYASGDPINFFDPTGLTQADLEIAMGWIATLHPELYRGINPSVSNESIDDDSGITHLNGSIGIDFADLDGDGSSECSTARIKNYVTILSHELMHAQDLANGKYFDLYSPWRHNDIYRDSILIGQEYEYGK